MKKIRAIVVDDSELMRKIITEMLSSDPDIEVVATAEDPFDAREKIKKHHPDVITLDIEMPKMDGITFLEKIMKLRPMPVVMVSTLTQSGAEATIRALEIGAVDAIGKPSADNEEKLKRIRDELVEKVKSAASAKVGTVSSKKADGAKVGVVNKVFPYSVVGIGSSTGGIEALKQVLPLLPRKIPPVLIVQHLPESFSKSFADRMNSISEVKVKLSEHDEMIQPGTVYIAPGDCHLEIKKQGNMMICRHNTKDLVSGHRPSVDVLFHSIAENASIKSVGVILTGMGRDGAEGLLKMRQTGMRTFSQNKGSCVVYGMPRVAVEIGASEKEVSLEKIPLGIVNTLNSFGDKS